MALIFISYRRSDSGEIAGRIYDRLSAEFGKETIFRDVEDIRKGTDFRETLRKEVASCRVMLVIIGKTWASVTDREGNRRLDNPNDWVRFEIETALGLPKVRVIPVLVNGGELPSPEILPASLRELTFLNAMIVNPEPQFVNDAFALTGEIKQIRAIRMRRSRWLWVSIVAILLLIVFALAGALLLSNPDDNTPTPPVELAQVVRPNLQAAQSIGNGRADLFAPENIDYGQTSEIRLELRFENLYITPTPAGGRTPIPVETLTGTPRDTSTPDIEFSPTTTPTPTGLPIQQGNDVEIYEQMGAALICLPQSFFGCDTDEEIAPQNSRPIDLDGENWSWLISPNPEARGVQTLQLILWRNDVVNGQETARSVWSTSFQVVVGDGTVVAVIASNTPDDTLTPSPTLDLTSTQLAMVSTSEIETEVAQQASLTSLAPTSTPTGTPTTTPTTTPRPTNTPAIIEITDEPSPTSEGQVDATTSPINPVFLTASAVAGGGSPTLETSASLDPIFSTATAIIQAATRTAEAQNSNLSAIFQTATALASLLDDEPTPTRDSGIGGGDLATPEHTLPQTGLFDGENGEVSIITLLLLIIGGAVLVGIALAAHRIRSRLKLP